jgi:hypothetical protein
VAEVNPLFYNLSGGTEETLQCRKSGFAVFERILIFDSRISRIRNRSSTDSIPSPVVLKFQCELLYSRIYLNICIDIIFLNLMFPVFNYVICLSNEFDDPASLTQNTATSLILEPVQYNPYCQFLSSKTHFSII